MKYQRYPLSHKVAIEMADLMRSKHHSIPIAEAYLEPWLY
jgi:hypothetical protein